MATAPTWATELIASVCADHRRKVPALTWYNGTSSSTSGRTSYPYRGFSFGSQQVKLIPGRIHITAGTDETDLKMVLLHELAHWITSRSKRHGHDAKFWDKAFQLYAQHDLVDYARSRESGYMKGAKLAHDRLMKASA